MLVSSFIAICLPLRLPSLIKCEIEFYTLSEIVFIIPMPLRPTVLLA
jgi:hypothetical protein